MDVGRAFKLLPCGPVRDVRDDGIDFAFKNDDLDTVSIEKASFPNAWSREVLVE